MLRGRPIAPAPQKPQGYCCQRNLKQNNLPEHLSTATTTVGLSQGVTKVSHFCTPVSVRKPFVTFISSRPAAQATDSIAWQEANTCPLVQEVAPCATSTARPRGCGRRPVRPASFISTVHRTGNGLADNQHQRPSAKAKAVFRIGDAS